MTEADRNIQLVTRAWRAAQAILGAVLVLGVILGETA